MTTPNDTAQSIDRDHMLEKLAQCGIHVDSPCGGSIMSGRTALDDGTGIFTTPSPSGLATSRPSGDARTRGGTALDNGDLVAHAMGLMPSAARPSPQSAAPARELVAGHAQIDNSDLVAAAMGLCK